MKCLKAFGRKLVAAKNDGPSLSSSEQIGSAKSKGTEGGLHG